jgi:F-type H+-transporting ATPase subunit epsilon
VDLVTALVPGIMSWEDAQEHERFLAVDQGLLVKSGDLIQVATRTATAGELGELHQRVDAMLASRREREAGTRTAVARLESGFIRRFMEFERHG